MSAFFSTFTEMGLVDTRLNPGTILLPKTTEIPYRVITLKDIYGKFATNALTLTTQAGESFEDGTTTKIFRNDGTFISLYAVTATAKWYIVGGTQTLSQTISSLTVSTITGDGGYLRNLNAISSFTLLSTIQGLGSLGYLSSAVTNLSSIISTPQLTSSLQGLGTLGYVSSIPSNFISSAALFSTIQALGTLGYLSSATTNLSSIISTPQLTSTIQGLGTLGYISSTQLFSTIANLGQIYNSTTLIAGTYITFSSNGNQITINGQASGGTSGIAITDVMSTVRALGTIGYVSTSQLTSSFQGISQIFTSLSVSVSSLTATSLNVSTTAFISSLTVNSLTIGDGTGYLYMGDLITTSLSTLQLNSGIVYGTQVIASSFQGDGSQMVNAPYISSTQLQSTIRGLGTLGYLSSAITTINISSIISTPQLTSSLQGLGTLGYLSSVPSTFVSSATLFSTVQSLGTLGYISSTQLVSTAQGLTTYINSFIDPQELASSITGLGTVQFISSIGLLSTSQGLANYITNFIDPLELASTVTGLGTAQYVSTTVTTTNAIYTSSLLGLGSMGYLSSLSLSSIISTPQLTSTVIGLGRFYNSTTLFAGTNITFDYNIDGTNTIRINASGTGGGSLTNANVTSSLQGLGLMGYVSSMTLFSTIQGLGTLGYLSSSVGLAGQVYLSSIISTPQLTSTVIGLGQFYNSTTLFAGTNITFDYNIDGTNTIRINASGTGGGSLTNANVTSSLQGLGLMGYVSSATLFSTIQGLGTLGYLSSSVGLAGQVYLSSIISTPQLTSTVQGLGTVGFLSVAVTAITAGLGIGINQSNGNVTITNTTAAGAIISTFYTLTTSSLVASSFQISAMTATYGFFSTLQVNVLQIGSGTGYINTGDLIATSLSTIQVNAGTGVFTNLYVGATSSFNTIQFYGLDGLYKNTAIAEVSTGIAGSKELLLFTGSTTTDRIRLQTTGDIRFEPGVSQRLFSSTQLPPQAVPAMILDSNSNVGIGLYPSSITNYKLDVAGQIRSQGFSSIQVVASSFQGDGSQLTGIITTGLLISTVNVITGYTTSTTQGLGSLGYISSTGPTQLAVTSTTLGLGTLGYLSSRIFNLQSTFFVNAGNATSLPSYGTFTVKTGFAYTGGPWLTQTAQLQSVTNSFSQVVLNVDNQTLIYTGSNTQAFRITYTCGGNQNEVATTRPALTMQLTSQGITRTYQTVNNIESAGASVTNVIQLNQNDQILFLLRGLENYTFASIDTNYYEIIVEAITPMAVTTFSSFTASTFALLDQTTAIFIPFTVSSGIFYVNGQVPNITPLYSTSVGLGSAGYISSQQLTSTVEGLGLSGYISSQQLISTVQGLGLLGYISTQQLTSTVQGLSLLGYISTSQLTTAITSTTQGLSLLGYVSTSQLRSTVEGVTQNLGFFGYISTQQLTSTTQGLSLLGYISSTQLMSTVEGLGLLGYISSTQLTSTAQGITAYINSFIDPQELASTVTGLGTQGMISTSGLLSTAQGLSQYILTFIDPLELASTVTGLGTTQYISTLGLATNITSTTQGLGLLGYLSSSQLLSTTQSYSQSFTTLSASVSSLTASNITANSGYISSLIVNYLQHDFTTPVITMTDVVAQSLSTTQLSTILFYGTQVIASSLQGDGSKITGAPYLSSVPSTFISSAQLLSSLQGLASMGYISSTQLTSTVQGLSLLGYISTQQLTSTTQGLSLLGYVSSTQLGSTVQGITQGLASQGYVSSTQLTSTSQGLSLLGYLSTAHLTSSLQGLGTLGYFSSITAIINYGFLTTPNLTSTVSGLGQVFTSLSVNISTLTACNVTATTGFVSTLTVNVLTFGTGTGYINTGDVIATSMSTIQINAGSAYINNLYVGANSTFNAIQFYGLDGLYKNTAIAEVSTGIAGSKELLLFTGSTTTDRIRLQTTGDIRFEPGVSQRLFSSTQLPPQAVPAMILDSNSNVGIGLYPSSITNYKLDVAGQIRSQGLSTLQIIASTFQGDGTQLTGIATSINIGSTLQGLGTYGYISTVLVTPSSLAGLGSLGYISSTGPSQLAVTSTTLGLGSLGYLSSRVFNLQSTFYINSQNLVSMPSYGTFTMKIGSVYTGAPWLTQTAQLQLGTNNFCQVVLGGDNQTLSYTGTTAQYFRITYTCGGNQNEVTTTRPALTMQLTSGGLTKTYQTVNNIESAGASVVNVIQLSPNDQIIFLIRGLENYSFAAIDTTYYEIIIESLVPLAVNTFSTLAASSLSLIDQTTGNYATIGLSTNAIYVNGVIVSAGGPNLYSTVVGLGSAGYISTQQLTSTAQGLGLLGYISTTQLTSTVQGLSLLGYISTTQLTSTTQGLSLLGYISTSQLTTAITSTTQGLSVLGYLSTSQLISTVEGVRQNLGFFGYLSTQQLTSTTQGLSLLGYVSSTQLTSTTQGLSLLGYISSTQLMSTVEGLGLLGYISSTQLTSTAQGITAYINSFIDPQELASTITGLGTQGMISTSGLLSTAQGLSQYILTFIDPLELASTVTGLGTTQYISTLGLATNITSTTQGLGLLGYLSSSQLLSTTQSYSQSFTTLSASVSSLTASNITANSGYISSLIVNYLQHDFTTPVITMTDVVAQSLSTTQLSTILFYGTQVIASSLQGDGSKITGAPYLSSVPSTFISSAQLLSSLQGLASMGYISSTQLTSTTQGLSLLGYLSSTQLISTVQGITQGLASQGYISSTQLISTVQGLSLLGYISTQQLTSTTQGLSLLGYVSSTQLGSTVQGITQGLASQGYVSSTQLASTVQGLSLQGYVSSTQLTSSLQGLGTLGFLSSITAIVNYGFLTTPSLTSTVSGLGQVFTSLSVNISTLTACNVTATTGFVSTLTVNVLTFGTGTGYINTGDVIATSMSTIQINAGSAYINNLYVGATSSFNTIQFYGLDGLYKNTAIAELSTGVAGSKELLLFTGSTTTDRIRLQTTGDIRFEPGVSQRLFSSTQLPPQAVPAMILDSNFNVGIGLYPSSITNYKLDVAGQIRSQGLSSLQVVASTFQGDGSQLTGILSLTQVANSFTTLSLNASSIGANVVQVQQVSTLYVTASTFSGRWNDALYYVLQVI